MVAGDALTVVSVDVDGFGDVSKTEYDSISSSELGNSASNLIYTHHDGAMDFNNSFKSILLHNGMFGVTNVPEQFFTIWKENPSISVPFSKERVIFPVGWMSTVG